MCGINGFLDPGASRERGALESIASAMADTLAHRGPDDSGTWVDAEAGIALGFRRLAIVDLSPSGHQPMVSANGRYVIVFNGEVYNFQRLRAELEPLGHHFRGTSDTEVMLEAICRWGLMGALERFIGMFAFALWDREQRTLSLARDRLGIKPLYYGRAGSALLFGSELKALRAFPGFNPEVDRRGLALLLRYNCVPAPHTIYRGVHKLPPGTVLTLTADRPENPVPKAFWSAREVVDRGLADPFRGSAEEAIDELDRLARDAVRLRMIADVPLGAFLSGGVDSSAVVALMQAQSSRPVKTFTIGFREPRYDEAAHARAVAEHLGTEHTELYVEPSHALEVVSRIPDWYDEPFSDSSQLPTFLVAEMTRRHVTVALSGDGGDELFAGYTRYAFGSWLRAMLAVPLGLRRFFATTLERFSPVRIDSLVHWLPQRVRPRMAGDKVHKAASVLALGDRHAVYNRLVSHWADLDGVLDTDGNTATDFLAEVMSSAEWSPSGHFIQEMQYLDLVTYLPDDILAKVDRATMAVSLEARVPLLDHRIVEFAWRLPLELKVRHGKRKWILRQLLYRYVPSALIDRPKMGFGVPIGEWLRGPLREWAEELLSERRIREDGYFDPSVVRRKWDEHQRGERNWQHAMWTLLMFQAWNERWMKPLA